MRHTLLVIGAAIERAAKAIAAKNVDFMLMDLSDEAGNRGLMLRYVFKISSPQVLMDREESKKKLSSVLERLFHKKQKKNSTLPIPLMQKTTSCLQRGHERRCLASFRWHVRVLPLCSLALAMHTIAVTSEGIAMGRRKYGTVASHQSRFVTRVCRSSQ